MKDYILFKSILNSLVFLGVVATLAVAMLNAATARVATTLILFYSQSSTFV